MTTGRRIEVRAFLEGIEIPCIGAVLQIAPDVPSLCSVQVIATDSLFRLKDRTIVHIFFKDFFFEEAPDDPDDLRHYKLFFIGEVRAIQVSKRVGSRSAVLQCEDLSAYWDQCLQYFGNYAKGGDGFWDRTSSFFGANTGLFDNILRSVQTMTSLIVNGKSVTRPETKGLLSGVLRLFERMGGVYSGKQRFRGQNDFFSAAELRLRMIDQIGVPEKDTTSAKLVQVKAFIEWITNTMGGMGGLVSYRDILKILFNYTFYHAAPNPLAFYQGPVERTVKSYKEIPEYEKSVHTKHFQKIEALNRGMDAAVAKANAVVADSSKVYLKSPDPNLGAYRTTLGKEIAHLRTLTFEIIKVSKGVPQGDTVIALMRSIDSLLSAGFKMAEFGHTRTARAHLLKAKDTLRRSYPVPLRREVTTRTEYVRERLYSQFFSPELFCCAPPRCNVLFPEHQIQFEFKRDFRAEVTRMRIQTKYWLEGAGSTQKYQRGGLATSLLGAYYYAPEIRGTNTKKFLGSNYGFARLLLPHERFSGIIPSVQTLGRVNFYLSRKDAQYKKSAGGISYVQRAANFKFFLDRFAAREISITGPFNPYAICSLPVVVLDRYNVATLGRIDGLNTYSPDVLDLSDLKTGYKSPTHFVGVLQQLTHSLGLDGPVTSYGIRHVRTHKERSELLGAGDQLELRKTNKSTEARKKTASLLKKQYEDLETILKTFPNRAQARRVVQDLIDFSIRIRETAEKEHFIQAMRQSTRIAAILSQCEVHIIRKEWPQAEQQYKEAYELTKTFSLAASDLDPEVNPLTLPIEEVLRPPWYDKMFDNANIGTDYYQPLFGCDSICDGVPLKNEQTDTGFKLQAATIQNAIDQIYTTYGQIKQNNTQATTFIRAITERPIATLPQVIGPEGFHRHAFGEATGFSDIVKDPSLGILNEATTIRQIDPSLDIRAERREVVKQYLEELRDNVILG